ncbi:5-formyltetrahydrofolate cyclo-ligase [Sphaerotilaceae bacterium SBD11-9]
MTLPSARQTLRQRLLESRERFVSSSGHGEAQDALAVHVSGVLATLEPGCLGAYWPIRSEFNAGALWRADKVNTSFSLALPFTRREPRQMHYRQWDGREPSVRDECGIASTAGREIVPDVVLVPCVGFTASGYRLGYGGGYFDRWLAAHPHVTAVGVAWSVGEVSEAEFAAEPHDLPLALVVTERGVVS